MGFAVPPEVPRDVSQDCTLAVCKALPHVLGWLTDWGGERNGRHSAKNHSGFVKERGATSPYPLICLVKSCGFIDQRNDALWSHITDDEKRQELLKCPLVIQPNGVVLTSLILQIFCWARVLCWAISGSLLRITIPVISYCQKNVLLYIVFSNLLELPFDLICKSDKKMHLWNFSTYRKLLRI